MNSRCQQIATLFAAYCFASVVAVATLMRVADGQEALPAPLPKLSGADARQVLIADHPHGILILANLPHLEQLFKNVCSGPTPCEQMLQQLGIQSNEDEAATCAFGAACECPEARQTIVLDRLFLGPHAIIDTRDMRSTTRRLKVSAWGPPACDEHATCGDVVIRRGCTCSTTGDCTCGQAVCGTDCAAAGCADCRCDDCKCASCPGKANETTCGNECCPQLTLTCNQADHDEFLEYHPLKLMRHIAGLAAEKAAAEAALAVKTESHEKLAELFESMAELLADNAALDAQLEAKAEHVKLVEKLAELSAENARLKAHVELAAERAELTKALLTLRLENEQLKNRLAEHEHKQPAAARTADQSHGEHRPR